MKKKNDGGAEVTIFPKPKLVTLHQSNYREVVPTLKNIIEQIEAGNYGEIGCLGVVLMGDRTEVFGMGPDSAPPSVALLLHAGFMRLSKAIEEHGE